MPFLELTIMGLLGMIGTGLRGIGLLVGIEAPTFSDNETIIVITKMNPMARKELKLTIFTKANEE